MSFLCFCTGWLVAFSAPLKTLFSLALDDTRYTTILSIPFIIVGLLWLNRRNISIKARYCPTAGLAWVLAGLTLSVIVSVHVDPPYAFAMMIVGALVALAGGFAWCYGLEAAREAKFPLFLLFLIVPIPDAVLGYVAIMLQRASASTASVLFGVTGVPAIRKGAFQFVLPGVSIEVAEGCSGIRSTLSLLISSLLASYLLLRSTWAKALLVLLTIPIAIFRNAVRIVLISWLGVYVDPGFFVGTLHSHGGPLFFVVALVPLSFLLGLLARTERFRKRAALKDTFEKQTSVT